jgi:hypothetical protein
MTSRMRRLRRICARSVCSFIPDCASACWNSASVVMPYPSFIRASMSSTRSSGTSTPSWSARDCRRSS